MGEAPISRGTRIPLIQGRTELELRGRGGYTLDLLPGNIEHQYSWAPIARDLEDKIIASDLDLQLMWTKAIRPNNNPPLVYWRIQYGHGEVIYDVPQRNSLAAAAPELFDTPWGWVLPQRGLRVRLPARELRVFLYTPPEAPPPPEPAEPGGAPCSIQISVQPCFGMQPQLTPITDLSFGQTPPGRPSQFPLGATEVKFSDPTSGLPFAAGNIALFDITGTSVGGAVALTALTDWVPIPLFAAFWVSDAATVQASYR